MSQRQLYLAAYDVAKPDRLRQALHVLRDYATGGQKSVFECFLTDKEKRELLQRMAALTDPEKDRFFLIRLSLHAKTCTLGLGVKPVEPKFFYLG